MSFPVFQCSSKGANHAKNEDSLRIGDNFIIVADGMGGENEGEIASRIAADTLADYLKCNLRHDGFTDIKEIIFSAIKKANSCISEYVDAHPQSYGMGTTVLVLAYNDEMISVAWCGDSRCYIYKDDELKALTKDHSYVQQLIDDNKISVEASFRHPDNNLITRCLGGYDDTCEPDYVSCRMTDADMVILCSDGLSGYCRDSDIKKVLASNSDPELLPASLIELAVENGSDDDITIATLICDSNRVYQRRKSIFDWFRRKP